MRKVEYTEWIESYLSNELTPEQKKEFEAELEANETLMEEFNLHVEIQDALSEKDVMNLKANLERILNSEKFENGKIAATFDLAEDMDVFNEFESQIDPKELLNYYESLPKLHIYQHEIASKENIHHFYKEQELTKAGIEEEEVISDEALMMEIESAIMEKDVLQLRDNLKQIAKSMPEHDFSHEQIDEYVNDTMPEEVRVEFEKELATNARLAADVRLHRNLEEAVLESDVMQLRDSMRDIMKTQTSYNQDFVEIEHYLENELTAEQLAEFENDMFENRDLKTDVKLHKEVELAASETDVMNLRSKLQEARKDVEARKEKSVIKLDTSRKSAFVWYSAAVVLLIAFGFSVAVRLQSVNNQEIYNSYVVNEPAMGTSRSADKYDQTLNSGKELFNAGKYEEAAMMFQVVIDRDKNNSIPRFFLGNSLQNMRKSLAAIKEYKQVIANNENTYKDLAEFNIGLCYLLQNDRNSAVEQFKRVSRDGNYYSQDAKAILRELKYEDKE